MKDVNCYFIIVNFILWTVATNYCTLKNKPVIFQSKLALQLNLARYVSNIDAQVPWNKTLSLFFNYPEIRNVS